MKISKLLGAVAAITLAFSALSVAPANADCYWGSDGVLVIDSTGQCTISVGPPFVDPNSGSTPSPSASPSEMPLAPVAPPTAAPEVGQPTPTATPSPSPSATPVTAPKPVKVPTVKHVVTGLPGEVNHLAIKRIYLIDTVDPSYYTECWYATYCALEAPKGHTWRFNILSDYPFIAGLDGEGSSLASGLAKVVWANGEFSASLVSKQTGDTEVFFAPTASPLKLLSRTDKDVEVAFNNERFADKELSFEQGEPVAIYQLVKSAKKINWSNLPPGLVEAADGTISGTPTTAGRFQIEGAFGSGSTRSNYKLPINVAAGLNAPADVTSSWTDLTTAKLAFATEATTDSKTIPDFFEIEVTNTRTSLISFRYFDGSSRAGTILYLLPGDDYKIRIRSAKALSVPKYSAFSAPFTLKAQLPTQYFKSDSDSVSLRSTWAKGSKTKIVVTIPNKKNGQVQSRFSKSLLRVTEKQKNAFNKHFDGLYLKRTGEINGTITESDLKKKPLNITLGTVAFVFTPDAKK